MGYIYTARELLFGGDPTYMRTEACFTTLRPPNCNSSGKRLFDREPLPFHHSIIHFAATLGRIITLA